MFTTAEILRLVDTIYAGVLDSTAWEAAIIGLCRALGGEAALLVLHDPCSQAVESAIFIGIDQTYQRNYAELTAHSDMRGAYSVIAASVGLGALTGGELAQASPDFARSRFHAEWHEPQRITDFVAAPLAPSPSLVGGLFISRPRRGDGYGDCELDALRALRPHLVRAVQVRLRLDGAMSVARDALAALDLVEQGVLLVDAGATVVHANLAAEVALGRGDGLRAARSVLGCDRADDTATLRRLVGEASAAPAGRPGGTLAVGRRSGRRPLSVLVAPLRGERPVPRGPAATAIVLIADPDTKISASGTQLRKLYGLTAAEARTAEALLDHRRLADMAAKLGVTLATVRTLLQRTFEKTETHSQAELVHLMLAHRLAAEPQVGPNGVAAGD